MSDGAGAPEPRPERPASGRLIILAGPPASGKSTLARALCAERGAVSLEPDAWLTALELDLEDDGARDRVEALQGSLALDLVTQGATVVLDWGAYTRAKRAALHDGARARGAAVELHAEDAPAAILWRRLRDRDGEAAPTRAEFDAMLADWEPVSGAEAAAYDPPPG